MRQFRTTELVYLQIYLKTIKKIRPYTNENPERNQKKNIDDVFLFDPALLKKQNTQRFGHQTTAGDGDQRGKKQAGEIGRAHV